MSSHPVADLCNALGLSPVEVVSLGSWPSPVRRLERLSARLGRSIWIKDDGIAAAQYGGNKPRKLELLLREARARSCDTILTIGAVGSNQILATAIYGSDQGFETLAIVHPRMQSAASDREVTSIVQAASRGVRLVACNVADVGDVLDDLLDELDERAYVVPAGGSTPLGNLAFVAAAFELSRQVASGELPAPDEIVVPLGTGGTAAGLAVGCALASLECRIIGVRAAGPDVVGPATVERQVAGLFALLRTLGWKGDARPAAPVVFVDDQLGAGYGETTAEADAAVALAEELEGLRLEPTYTGKAMASLLARSQDSAGRNVLFWNTANAVPLAPVDAKDLRDGALPPQLRAWLWPDRP